MLGLGNNSTSEHTLGLLIHSSYILNESGVPLGILSQEMWTRSPESRGKKHLRKSKPITEKESSKWLLPLEKCEEVIPMNKHEVWIIGDRESDVFEYMSSPRHHNCHLLIRSSQPRKLKFESKDEDTNLYKHIETLPVQGHLEVEISRHNLNEKVELLISYDNVKILSPYRKGQKQSTLQMGVIYARENTDKKDGIKWVLLVDTEVTSIEDAVKYLKYYAHRWKIERFHYILKQGLKIESLQFDDIETMKNAIALYSIVGWYTHWLTHIGREYPETPAKEVLDETSIEILTAYTKKTILTALDIIMAIGILGGFLGGSKRYPYPGLKCIWIGIQKLEAMKEGWFLAKSQFLKFYAT